MLVTDRQRSPVEVLITSAPLVMDSALLTPTAKGMVVSFPTIRGQMNGNIL
jgi:hypothetical protein